MKLKRRLERAAHKAQKRIKVINSIEACNGEILKLVRMTGILRGKSSTNVRKMIEGNDRFDRDTNNLLKFLELAEIISEIT